MHCSQPRFLKDTNLRFYREEKSVAIQMHVYHIKLHLKLWHWTLASILILIFSLCFVLSHEIFNFQWQLQGTFETFKTWQENSNKRAFHSYHNFVSTNQLLNTLKKKELEHSKSSACIFAQLQPSRRILNSKQINHIEEA